MKSRSRHPQTIGRVSIEFVLCARADEVLHLEGDSFKIGTGAKCEIRFDAEKDAGVADLHCTLTFEKRNWFLTPASGECVWLNDKEVRKRTRVTNNCMVFLGSPMGPGMRIFGQSETVVSRRTLAMLLQRGGRQGRMVEAAASRVAEEMGKKKKGMRRALFRVKKRESRKMRVVVGVLIGVFLLAGMTIGYQALKLRSLKTLAESIFYSMKALEVEIAKTELEGIRSGSARAQLVTLSEDYDRYLDDLKVGINLRSYEDRLILRMARTFGECELNMPEDFANTVKSFIRKWQSSPRLETSIARSISMGYVDPIVQSLLAEHLPPQFFYIALQESDFDVYRCGPRTRFGIAKGMWQFIPSTAIQYGLRIGPLAQVPVPDPRDERHDFTKSTRAAVRYLKWIYSTEAQASGLLVLASYNYGDTRIRQLIREMEESPRSRNFWNLMQQVRLPKQTYDYVFYIFSASVIGEDPRHFGFDFDNPLSDAIVRATENML